MEESGPRLRLVTNDEPEPENVWRCPVCAVQGNERTTMVMKYGNIFQTGKRLNFRAATQDAQMYCATCDTPVATKVHGRWTLYR